MPGEQTFLLKLITDFFLKLFELFHIIPPVKQRAVAETNTHCNSIHFPVILILTMLF